MGRPPALSRERIIDGAAALIAEHGADALSARRLGEALGCDPSALYRHFEDMGELKREVGDRYLATARVGERTNESWRCALRRICIELRKVQLRQPRLAALVRAAPTRLANELRITEALLRELARGGFDLASAASAYHSLIELTVGSAAIDADLGGQPAADRRKAYREWQRHYAALDPIEFPHAVAIASHLYVGSADARFLEALDALLAGLSSLERQATQ
ncbi:MAG TPA: TetR/AcrR family transcriptional regulator C-terminal domain-containing protein [Ilumatobacteraceae bacterium]|nr:TetR/AcrR family transcriptional regulator C-terminal domain-containing protein [Ilumatobacteraceae bacterium]